MATINLLPWRDELREEQRSEFHVMTAMFLFIGILVVVVWKLYLDGQIETQAARNLYLKTHIADLDLKVQEIADLKEQKSELVERMSVIQSLQGNRPEIVHIFDEIVRALPDGVFYDQIIREDRNLEFVGIAESNNRVSSLMRQLNSSPWFTEPKLKNVKSNLELGPQANNFELTVSIVSADIDAEDDKNKKQK